jgi:ceramide glucosyltransferase
VLARTVVATTVPERSLTALWRHELRWARTIRALEPAGFAASVLQFPLYWSFITVIVSGGSLWASTLFFGSWLARASASRGIDRTLAGILGGLAFRCPVWLLPLRDVLSASEWLASHAGRSVDWRGLTLEADSPSDVDSPAPVQFKGFTKGSHAR